MKPMSFTGFTFTTTPDGAGWVIVDKNGTLNGTNGTTRPILASEYATVVNDHQLQLMALNTAATYTLGSSVDTSGAKQSLRRLGWDGVRRIHSTGIEGDAVHGNLQRRERQHHRPDHQLVVRRLRRPVRRSGAEGRGDQFLAYRPSITGLNYVGAVAGYSVGYVNDDLVYGGSVNAAQYVGGLRGYNAGVLSVAYITDNVLGTDVIGDVVGQNSTTGTISRITTSGQTISGATKIAALPV